MKRNFRRPVWFMWVALAIAGIACNIVLPAAPLKISLPGQEAPTATPFTPPAARDPGAPAAPGASQTAPEPTVELPASPLPTEAPPTAAPEAGMATPVSPGVTLILPAVFTQPAIWIDPRLPAGVRELLARQAGFTVVDQPEQASMHLEPGNQGAVSQWVFAVVSPFSSKQPGISFEALQSTWEGAAAGPFAGQPLLMDESTQAVFTALWGAPAAGAVNVLPAGELLEFAWGHQPSWAMIPFEALDPRWKVLDLDGLSPLRKDFDLQAYPLKATISLTGDPSQVAAYTSRIPASNRDPGKLTVLTMTGVTALVRATAYTMERQGVLYPGRDVGDWLRSADLTHISNEVPFAQDCPFPNPVQTEMRFCSDSRYISLLEEVGTDIVELTGDHFQDWGTDAMLYTLDLYRQRSWQYYGGGANLDEGRQAITVEHNGNRLAFIGCNAKGGGYAQAGPSQPGAAACGYDWMIQEIARLRSAGYLPIATFQHFEYYTYQAQPNQKRDFRAMAEAGAVIVSGSQAHQPQAFEFDNGALIHYGLGNLFFDQYDVSLPCRQAFIDRHVFYGNRYIGTELLPIMFVDYARPRPMTPEERNDLLDAVFSASGW